MTSRLALVLLLLASLPAAAQRTAVRLELSSPREITVVAGEIHPSPMRLRVVRDVDGRPQPGVGVFLSVSVVTCAPLIECDLPPGTWYGYWHGADPANPYEAHDAYAISGSDGFVPVPALVGGSMRWAYTIAASIDDYASPFMHVEQERVVVHVDQVSPPSPRVRTVPVAAVAPILALVLAASALCYRSRLSRGRCG